MALSKLVYETAKANTQHKKRTGDDGQQQTSLLRVLSLTDFPNVVITIESVFKIKMVPRT